MKNFSSRTKENFPRRYNRGQLIRVLLACVAAVLVLFFARKLIGGVTAGTAAGVYRLQAWFANSSATIPRYLRERGELMGELEALKAERLNRTGKDLTLEKLAAENQELRALLHVGEQGRIAAGVIATPPRVPYDSLLIDRGTAHGIHEGAVVYQAEDHAIGYVVKTYDSLSLVKLLSSPGAVATVFVFGPDIFTTLSGEGGGVMRVSVPQGLPVAAGDLVVLPSLASGVVGRISTIVSTPTKPEQDAFVVFDIPLQSQRLVSVADDVPGSVSFEDATTYLCDARAAFLTPEFSSDVLTASSSEENSIMTPPPYGRSGTTTE